ncbi:MAG: hypothetical protein ACRD3V_23920 [Vicinamibacteria bacterium]
MKTIITRVSGMPYASVAITGKPAATPTVTTGLPVVRPEPPRRRRRGGHLRLVR